MISKFCFSPLVLIVFLMCSHAQEISTPSGRALALPKDRTSLLVKPDERNPFGRARERIIANLEKDQDLVLVSERAHLLNFFNNEFLTSVRGFVGQDFRNMDPVMSISVLRKSLQGTKLDQLLYLQILEVKIKTIDSEKIVISFHDPLSNQDNEFTRKFRVKPRMERSDVREISTLGELEKMLKDNLTK